MVIYCFFPLPVVISSRRVRNNSSDKPSQASTLFRECPPLMIANDDLGKPSHFATRATNASFALLSTGGAFTQTFSSFVPAGVIHSLPARGLRRIPKVKRSTRHISIGETFGCGGTFSIIPSSSASSITGRPSSSPCSPLSSPLITPSRLSCVVSIALNRARKLSR